MFRDKTALYALLACYEIADQQRGVQDPVCVRACDITAKYGLPWAYLAKLLRELAYAEVLDAVRGPQGGFRLNRPMKDITLLDIFDGVGAITILGKPHTVKGTPRRAQAAMNRARDEAAESVKELLSKRTLADLFKSR